MPTAAPVLAYKIVVSDLDGTLLDNLGRISERTQAAVEEIRASGARFIIATARPLREAIRIARTLALSDPVICQNGAIIAQTPQLDNIWNKYLIDYPTFIEIVGAIRAESEDAAIAVDYPLYRIMDPDWPGPFSAIATQATLWPMAPEEFPRRRPACVLVRNVSLDKQMFEQALGVTVTSSESGLIEISRRGVDKAKALKHICKKLDIAPELVASFGDMPNDLTMLQFSGLGVAMSNAADTVRRTADHVAPSNDHDGVAKVLEQLLLGVRLGSTTTSY